jgi:hypothetical protein
MGSIEHAGRREDPYASAPAWRVDELERRLARAEEETRHTDNRISALYQTLVERTLIQILVLAVVLLIFSVAAAHH